jgi:NADPH:quinone reductase-like Zn-dependent oxidoreductase
VLRLASVPVPVPGPDEVLIEVAAAGANRHAATNAGRGRITTRPPCRAGRGDRS